MAQKAQHAILRFVKHKAGPAGALEAHHERTKEQYASNPDIDTSRSRDNFHIIQPAQKYRREIDSRIKAAGCRTRKDSTMFVDTLISRTFPVLKRGESALVTKRKHIPTWLFKQSIDLTRQQQAIEKAVSEIGVLNAGKKRDEVLEMVGPTSPGWKNTWGR